MNRPERPKSLPLLLLLPQLPLPQPLPLLLPLSPLLSKFYKITSLLRHIRAKDTMGIQAKLEPRAHSDTKVESV